MPLHEADPLLEQLKALPQLAPDPARSSAVRRRCHALMERQFARETVDPTSRHTRRHVWDVAALLAIGIYLVAAAVEAVRLVR